MVDINETFTPSAPIRSRDLFAGRNTQLNKVMNTIFQPGQHAVLYGDRGVGKTSLANTIFDLLVMVNRANYRLARINCSEEMDFFSMWRTIFRQIEVTTIEVDKTTLDGSLIGSLPENVREVFELLREPSIIIIDEMDRLSDNATKTSLADTIKTLSDNAVQTTLILVGVADSIDELIAEHRSIERAIVQVHMPPMSTPELLEIVDRGFLKVEMVVEPNVRSRLADFAQGLPSYSKVLLFRSTSSMPRNGLQAAIATILNIFFRRASTGDQWQTASKTQTKNQTENRLDGGNKTKERSMPHDFLDPTPEQQKRGSHQHRNCARGRTTD